MGIQLKNNASGTLATAISASDTGIVLTTGSGASFPALGATDYFYATLESTGGTLEIVKVTARSGDSITVVRAQDGSTANSFAAGSRFEMRVNAGSVTGYVQERSVAANIKAFGAVGDGVADDTAAIQAAINSFGGDAANIYIPAGTYKTTAALNVLGNLNTIFGDGDNSIIAPVGAINVFVIGNGVDGVNFGTFRDFSIASSDGLQIRGIWGRLLRQFHFVNIVMRTNTVGLKNFSIAGIQCDFSWSCNFTSVTIVGFVGKGYWLGQDPATASNQCNDFTLTGCHAYVGTGIGYHLKGSGISLLGCLAEQCEGGGVQGNFVPGINVSGGYYEDNGATSGFSFYITEAQNAGGISNVFINNFNTSGSKCIVLEQVETFVISGCNLRVHAAGIGVELGATVSNVYLIANKNEGSTGTLYAGTSYPANARISDTFIRFTDLFATDFKTDNANKKVYSGKLSATPGDATIFEIRGREGVVIFAGDPSIPSITSTAVYSTTVGATNRDVFVDNTGLLGYVTSTRESKKNIQPLDDVSWLLQLDPVSFNRRKKEIITDNGEKIGEQYLEETYQEKEYGLIADDVEPINKELCFYDDDKLAGVHYQKLITPLLKIVQDLHREIQILKDK